MLTKKVCLLHDNAHRIQPSPPRRFWAKIQLRILNQSTYFPDLSSLSSFHPLKHSHKSKTILNQRGGKIRGAELKGDGERIL